MIAYHNDPAIKAKYLARVSGHRRLDEIRQGYGYWKDGKGCAVGCTIHGDRHKAYETELGIPEPIARLEDIIFEGLPVQEAREWPGRFLSSIEPGVDLSRLQWRFLFWLLTEFDVSWIVHPIIGPAVKTCADLMHHMAVHGVCDRSAAVDAAWAAQAARAALSSGAARTSLLAVARGAAGWAAGAAAAAAVAAGAAGVQQASQDPQAAARAAWAAWAAWDSRPAAFSLMADKLIELISDCPYQHVEASRMKERALVSVV